MSTRIPHDQLRIDEDWRVVDLKTIEDCEEALVHLTRDIANIDAQLVDEDAQAAVSGVAVNVEWQSSAKTARSVKLAIKAIVHRMHGDLVKAARADLHKGRDRDLLSILKMNAPDAFAAAVSEMGDL